MEFNLIKAKKRDYNAISKIYADGFSEPPYNENWTLDLALKKIKIFSRYCDMWKIILPNKEIIGFIVINPNHWLPGKFCFGEDISVKKEYRKKGIASEVIKEIMKIYKEKGFEYFMGLSNNQSKAFKLWNKLGIKENKYDKIISKELK